MFQGRMRIKEVPHDLDISDFFFLLSRTHVSMVTSEHMNQLLKNVLNLIKKNIGNENAPWMTRIAGKLVNY